MQSSALGLMSLTGDRSPDDALVKALHKVTHHRLELLKGLGLQRIVQTVDLGRLTSSEIF